MNQITKLWGFYEHEIEQMLEDAQGFSRWRTRTETADEDDEGLSIGARLACG